MRVFRPVVRSMHALGGGAGHRSLTRPEGSLIPFKAADLS